MTQIIGANRRSFLAIGILAIAVIAFSGMQLRGAGADQYQIPGPTVLAIPADMAPSDECQVGLGFSSQFKYDLEEGEWAGSGAFDSTDLATLGILMNYDQGSGILYSWSTDLPIDAVVIKGAGDGHAYIYDPEATFGGSAPGEDGPGIMIAPLTSSGQQSGISHISFCYDRELSVAKTADGDWNEDLDWSIEKTVRDANIFVGEDAVFDVEVTLDNTNYIDTVVSGEITVTNNWGVASPATTLTDTVEFGGNSYEIPVSVGSIAPGASTTVSYSQNIGTVATAPSGGTNTVMAGAAGDWVDSATATVDIVWDGPSTTYDAAPDVTDNFAGTGSSSIGTGAGSYVVTIPASALAAGEYNNVACIDSDNGVVECANDDVTVHQLSVAKTGAGDYQVDHNWSIEKTVRDANIFVGENAVFDVVVTEDASDDVNVSVSGTISITNPSPDDATVSLVDAALVNPTYSENVGSILVPANDTVVVVYTDNRADNSSIADFTNTAFVTNSVGLDVQSASANVSFTAGVPIDATVDVTDNFANTGSSSIGTGAGAYVVTKSGLAAGSYNNVACIDSDNGVVECDNDDVTVHQLSVVKTGSAGYQVDNNWLITKAVRDADIFVGENAVFDVVVSEDGSDDVNISVSGSISITNPSPDATTVSLVDAALVNPVYSEGNIAAIAVPGNTTVVVGYTDDRANNSSTADFTNDAVVTNSIGGDVQTGSVDISFEAGTEIDATVDVYDTFNGGSDDFLGTVSGTGGSFVVTIPGLAAGSYNNVACVSDTGTGAGANDCDDADVTVHDLTVEKTASTSFNRTFGWDIAKTALWWDQSANEGDGAFVPFDVSDPALTDILGIGIEVQYSVDVATTTVTDADHLISGTVTVGNPTSPDATDVTLIDNIVDLDNVFANVPVVLIPNTDLTVPAGGSIGFTYLVNVDGLGEKELDENQVTVTNSTGGTSYDASASLDWSDSVGTVTNGAWAIADPGTFATDALGNSLGASVSILFSGATSGAADITTGTSTNIMSSTAALPNIDGVCGEVNWDNVVTLFVGGAIVDEDGATIIVDQTCANRLTRTPGYWKTHNDSFRGGTISDDTWNLIGPLAENQLFFDTGLTYFQILWTADKGNPYITLTRAYIAALLNDLAGTDDTELALFGTDSLHNAMIDLYGDGEILVEDVLGEAAGWLSGETIASGLELEAMLAVGNGSFPTRKQLRAAGYGGKDVAHFFNAYYPMLALAEYLDEYNNGIIGPGHAD